MAAYSDSNVFDKFCDIWPDNINMEHIVVLALMSKVILSYKIDLLKSFHQNFMEGLWKRSPNGCFYPLDKRHERVLYVVINENYDYEAELEKSKEQFRNFCTKKVFDEMPTSVLSTNELSENKQVSNALTSGFDNGKDIQVDDVCHEKEESQDGEISSSQPGMSLHKNLTSPSVIETTLLSRINDVELVVGHQILDKLSQPILSLDQNQKTITAVDRTSTSVINNLQLGVNCVFELPIDCIPSKQLSLLHDSNLIDEMLGHSFSVHKFWVATFNYLDTFWKMKHVVFDPGILKRAMGFTHTLEDKGVFRGEEESSVGWNWELCNSQTLVGHFDARWSIISKLSELWRDIDKLPLVISIGHGDLGLSSFCWGRKLLSDLKSSLGVVTHIFDPGGLYCLHDWRDGHMFILATFLTLENEGGLKREGISSHITSVEGVSNAMKRASYKLQSRLVIGLHALNQKLIEQIGPSEKAFSLEAVLKDFLEAGRWVFFEYTLS